MAIRNFWVSLWSSTRKHKVETGPQGRGGEIEMTVLIRDKGEISKALKIVGTVEEENYLKLEVVECSTGKIIWEDVRER